MSISSLKIPRNEKLAVQYMNNNVLTHIATFNATLGKYLLYSVSNNNLDKVTVNVNPTNFDSIVFGNGVNVVTRKVKNTEKVEGDATVPVTNKEVEVKSRARSTLHSPRRRLF